MRNTVVVTFDSLRADHCGFMGYDRETTPILDWMAEDGLVFENAIAPGPSTYTSMPSVFTGQLMRPLAKNSAETDNTLERRSDNMRLNMRSTVIPEQFQQEGYTTGAFTVNPYTTSRTNFARGFDHFEDFLSGKRRTLMNQVSDLPVFSEAENIYTMLKRERASKPWQSYYHKILDWVDSAEEPYFLWLFLLEPHTPYLAAPERLAGVSQVQMYYQNWKLWLKKKWNVPERLINLDRKVLVDLYDTTIQSSDEFVGQLWTDLESTNPLFVIHADHGEAFGERGIYGHQEHLYEENIHVPLMLYNAGIQGTVSEPTSLVALPELLSSGAAGQPWVPEPAYALSRNFSPPRVVVRGETWKYIVRIDPESRTPVEPELYDLRTDPEETENIVEGSPKLRGVGEDIVQRLLTHDTEARNVHNGVTSLEGI